MWAVLTHAGRLNKRAERTCGPIACGRAQCTRAGPKQEADPVHMQANLTHAGRFKHTDRAHMRTESMRANPVHVGGPIAHADRSDALRF